MLSDVIESCVRVRVEEMMRVKSPYVSVMWMWFIVEKTDSALFVRGEAKLVSSRDALATTSKLLARPDKGKFF
ncbi:hypothetical protein TNCV_1429401 [Trichonephila clavipes]|nr:hypothetical protein TNCV_1429401 [Trichonephila clavipes]